MINAAVPFDELEAAVAEQAEQLANIPTSQLAAMKLIVNQAYEQMGLHSIQALGPILDGLMRNTPDAQAFVEEATNEGVKAATQARDAAFADYSMGSTERRPNPRHVIGSE